MGSIGLIVPLPVLRACFVLRIFPNAFFYLPPTYFLPFAGAMNVTQGIAVLMEPAKTNGTAHNRDVCRP
jgi:hypothetical protein